MGFADFLNVALLVIGTYGLIPIVRLFFGDRVYEPTLRITTKVGIVCWTVFIVRFIMSVMSDDYALRFDSLLWFGISSIVIAFLLVGSILYAELGGFALHVDDEMRSRRLLEEQSD